uniref:Nuclease HARBI1 n=1 Tax=Cucumis melo TaxID=3656 RepID=A0A9I9E732_CUCME
MKFVFLFTSHFHFVCGSIIYDLSPQSRGQTNKELLLLLLQVAVISITEDGDPGRYGNYFRLVRYLSVIYETVEKFNINLLVLADRGLGRIKRLAQEEKWVYVLHDDEISKLIYVSYRAPIFCKPYRSLMAAYLMKVNAYNETNDNTYADWWRRATQKHDGSRIHVLKVTNSRVSVIIVEGRSIERLRFSLRRISFDSCYEMIVIEIKHAR